MKAQNELPAIILQQRLVQEDTMSCMLTFAAGSAALQSAAVLSAAWF